MRKQIQKLTGGVARPRHETAGESAFALGRTAWLVSLGAAASAGETGVAMFETLVEKGRRHRRSTVAHAQEAFTETSSQLAKLATSAGRMAQKQIGELLGQLGLPTRADVRELTRRVETLRQKLS